MSEGTIITFYSYKGGVGRTFTLANVASLLSKWGYKVLCIDWDLEAPGLHFYFQSRLVPQNPLGLIDFISDYLQGKQPSWHNYVASASFNKVGSPLLLMQAGHHDELYIQRLQNLNWETLYSEHYFGNFLEKIRNEWKENFDFVFIDSRTGITDIGDICTIQLPDLLVLPLTANEQSLSGSTEILNRLRITQANLPLDHGSVPVLPVISRFEGRVEYKHSEQWLAKFALKLAPFYKEWLHRDVKVEEILNFTRIPSVPFWSFGEELPVIDKGTDDPDDIGFSLETLAALVAQKFSSTDVLIRNRDIYIDIAKSGAKIKDNLSIQKSNFEGKSSLKSLINLFISYSPRDRKFLDRLQTHLAPLRRQGIIRSSHIEEIPAGVEWVQEINARLKEADLVLLLISPDYLASPASDQIIKLIQTRGGKARVIPVILRPVLWESFLPNSLQVLPSNTVPVALWKDSDAAFSSIVTDIYKVAVETDYHA